MTIDFSLQRVIDALAAMPSIDNFVPAVLRIVAETFGTENCSYYEHRANDLIRLRYWYHNGYVHSPEEIANFADESLLLLRNQAHGFTVADSHLGSPVRERTRAVVVDHTVLDPPSINTEFCKARGWELELNVPLVVAGAAEGALVLIRGAGNDWSIEEILLAERLAPQFALAIEASRVAVISKEVAIVREREVASRQRANELARHSAVIKQSVDSLVGENDFFQFIGRLLAIASESLRAPVVEYWRIDGPMKARLVQTCRDGVLYGGSDVVDDPRVKGLEFPRGAFGVTALSDLLTIRLVDMMSDPPLRDHLHSIGMNARQWCEERAVEKFVISPLLRRGRAIGALCLFIPPNRVLDDAETDLAYALAQQVSLAVRMTELAEAARRTAIEQELVLAAQQRIVEFARSNELMRGNLKRLSNDPSLEEFPITVLRDTMHETAADDGAIFVFDVTLGTLRATEIILHPPVVNELIVSLSQPFPPGEDWELAKRRRVPVVVDFITEGHLLPMGSASFLLGRGNRCGVLAPMFVNDEPYGFLSFAYKRSVTDVSKEDVGLVQVVAQQVSLALHLTQLAELSQRSAVALERQQVIVQERAHMAREIHDKLAQGYAAILMQQRAMRKSLADNDGVLIPHLNMIERLSRDNLAAARRTMDELRSDSITLGDLNAAISRLVDGWNTRSVDFAVGLSLDINLQPVPRYVESEICSVIGEALLNAQRHSRGNAASVTVQRTGEGVAIHIRDNGIGFDIGGVGPSFGIASMHERAARAGANVEILSTMGAGTEVRIVLGKRP